MAKVRGPLMSLNARGQIAKTLVFMGWKGLKTIRTYAVPANPNSAAQQAQRGIMGNAVEAWHSVNLTGADKTAWDLFAKTLAAAQSGFNAFCRSFINLTVAGKTPLELFDGKDTSEVSGQVDMQISTTTGKAVSVKWGESPGSLINTDTAAEDGETGDYKKQLTGKTPGSKIYAQFVVTTEANAGSQTGIYEFVVSAG